MQQVTTPIPEADIEMIPATRDAAAVSDDVQRSWALLFGKDNSRLRPALVSPDGALATFDPLRDLGEFTTGGFQPSGALRTPFAGADFDHLDVLVRGDPVMCVCTDVNNIVVDRRVITPRYYDAVNGAMQHERYYVRARNYQLFSIVGGGFNEAVIAWKRAKPIV